MVMGASDVLASASEAEADGYDVAIECVGLPELLQPCQAAVRRLGRIVVSGACAEPIGIEPVTALLKELTIRFSVCYRPDEFCEVIDAFDTGAIDPAPMLGPTVNLNRVADAFDLTRKTEVQGRVLVTPGQST
jgi:(R,R)-butanediol dehydrogenase/meso-butanediol dehydrogenase/diacetyl reductase